MLLLWRQRLPDEMLLGCGILTHHWSLHKQIRRAGVIHPRGRCKVMHRRGHILYAGCTMAHLRGTSSAGRLLTTVGDHCCPTYRMPMLESRRWSCWAASIPLTGGCGFHDHTLTRMNISCRRRCMVQGGHITNDRRCVVRLRGWWRILRHIRHYSVGGRTIG